MLTMKNRTAVAVTLGVWLAAIGSAAALTYDLNRPLLPEPVTARLVEPLHAAHSAAITEATSPREHLLVVPTITLVAQNVQRTHAPVVNEAVATPSLRDISQMHCADWRELDMGSGHVQVCD